MIILLNYSFGILNAFSFCFKTSSSTNLLGHVCWILDCMPMSQFSTTMFINVCVSFLVACCSLHSKATQTFKNHKREQQQGKTKKGQEENTYIRRRTTNIKTVQVMNHNRKIGRHKEQYTTRKKRRQIRDKTGQKKKKNEKE